MRKMSLCLCLLAVVAIAAPASAQTGATAQKLTGTVHCGKADANYTVDAGDKAGHVLTMQKGTCTWKDGQVAGLTAKSGDDASTGEMNGATGHATGYHTVTLDNGDKYAVRYSGSMTMAKDNTGTGDGKWTVVSGTGKLKGMKGSGTYKVTMAADGSADVTVDGEYTLAPAKPAAPAKKK